MATMGVKGLKKC